MHDNSKLEPTQAYFSSGLNAEMPKNFKGLPVTSFTDEHEMYLEDDDSVQILAQKVSAKTLYMAEYLYFWIEGEHATNMRFDFLYNEDATTLRRFNYSVVPSRREFTEEISSPGIWRERVVVHNFNNSLLSSFKYPDEGSIREIHCMTMDKFIANLGKSENEYLIKTYFPDVAFKAPIIQNLIEGGAESLIKYNKTDENFRQLVSTLIARNNSIRAINSSNLNKLKLDVKYNNCGILEAVVHVNYNENNEEFVDLNSIFHMFLLSNDIPFSRLKTEKDTNYKVFKESTKEDSPDFINKRVLQDWIDPKLNRMMDLTDVQALSEMNNSGRGLSFKILNYGNTADSKRYMTLNIYKDGKLEVKCFWDEQFGEDMNPGGTQEQLNKALSKVEDFVKELNKLNYSVPGSKKKKITVPTANNVKRKFFNTVTVFDYGMPLDYVAFTKYLSQYRAYIHLVSQLLSNDEIDTRSVELRYKRLHNYVQMKDVHRFIKKYLSERPLTLTDRERAELLSNISMTFLLSKDQAELELAEYEAKFEQKGRKWRKSFKHVKTDEISRILDRDVNTQSGVDIRIIKRNPKDVMDDHTYKCLILGVHPSQLGTIFHFLKQVIGYFKKHEELTKLKFKKEPNFLALLTSVQDKSEDDTIELTIVKEVEIAHQRKRALNESDDEQSDEEDITFGEPEPPVQTQEAAVEPEAPVEPVKPAAKTGKAALINSFLNLLQTRVKEAYSDSVSMSDGKKYSTKCQKSEGRQPLVIPVELADALKVYVDKKIAEFESQAKSATKAKEAEILNKLYEYKIHRTTLNRGVKYKPVKASTAYFYFCPLSWNMAVNSDAVHMAFPEYSDNTTTDKYIYMSPKNKFKSEYGNFNFNWKALADGIDKKTDKELMQSYLDNGETPHASYVHFMQNNADYSACRACCFKGAASAEEKQVAMKCLGSGSADEKTLTAASKATGTTSVNYIKAEGKFVEPNRFAFIPAKLNRIFNHDDSNLKIVSRANTTMTTGFDYYLRKGVVDGKFLNAIGELVPKIKDLVTYLADTLLENLELYKSLKKGAINQLFAPEELSEDTEQDAKISLQNFITYLQTGSSDINEDFLWDLLSHPDVILPTPTGLVLSGGVNIIICEVQIANKEVSSGKIKCPVGFEVSKMFLVDRPSIILYRYRENYEIITRVQERNRDVISNPLFEAGHPLITDIINQISESCHTFSNVKSEQELRKHMDSIERDSKVNRTLVSNAELYDLHLVLKMLKEADVALYVKSKDKIKQVVDSRNKVTHLILSEDFWLPIKPSGIDSTFPVVRNATDLPDLVAMVRISEQLERFGNFNGYHPYAFLLQPGEKVEDDVIIGLMLANGLICYTRPLTVKKFKKIESVIEIEHPDVNLRSTLKAHHFDMSQLLFGEESELWYDDYKDADQALKERNKNVADLRRAYSVRASFMNESYQRFRYELSRILELQENEAVSLKLTNILAKIPMGAHGEGMNEIRKLIKKVLTVLLDEGNYLTDPKYIEDTDKMLRMLGPMDIKTEDLTVEDLTSSPFDYVPPSIRYECFNRDLDSYREETDIHCQYQALYIPPNLNTGEPDMLDNYLSRVTDEILRIPIKRKEILNGQMSNMLTGLKTEPANAYVLGSDNIVNDFKRMYRTSTNYLEKIKGHYDVINPQNYTDDIDSKPEKDVRCAGRYVNLPSYWISKFTNMDWKVYDIRGSENCIYNELDAVIHEAKDTVVNTRNKIASIIGAEDFEGDEKRTGWQMALDFYSSYWRADYKHIKTKEDMLESIRSSPRHHLSELDLSLISRGYNVKFIILAKPTPVNENGIVCLKTTQTKGDDFIVLYLQGISDYSMVKNTGVSPVKSVFKLSELPEFLQKEYTKTCVKDNLPTIDAANFLYLSAPFPTIGRSGRVEFRSTTGAVVPNPQAHITKRLVASSSLLHKPPSRSSSPAPSRSSSLAPSRSSSPAPSRSSSLAPSRSSSPPSLQVSYEFLDEMTPTTPMLTKKPTLPKLTKKPTQPKLTKKPTQPKLTKKPTQPKPTKKPTLPKLTLTTPNNEEFQWTRIPRTLQLTTKPRILKLTTKPRIPRTLQLTTTEK